MEDSNITCIKEGTSGLVLIYLNDESLITSFSNLLPNQWQITETYQEATIYIDKIDSYNYKIQYIWNNKFESIICKKSNLRKSFSILNNLLTSDRNSLSSKDKKLCKLISSLNKTSAISIELLNLIEKNLSLNEFFFKISKIDFFNNFKTKHLFLHSKGLSVANHYIFKNSQSEESTIALTSFTELFNAVKKSKNRTFGQTNLKAADFNILGTCLAHELTFKDFNVIILFSNDNFLDQKEEDIVLFNNIIPFLKFALEITLGKHHLLFTKNLIKHTLEKLYSSEKHNNIVQNTLSYFIQKNSLDHSDFFDSLDVRHKDRMVLLGELLNTLKHELSNPFFGLQLSTDLLLTEDWKDPDNKEFATEMASSVYRCQNIIETFTNIYSNDDKISEVNLKTLTEEILTLTKSESRNIKKFILLKQDSHIVEDLNIFLNTNKTWLAQILFNVIINSVQAINLNHQTDGEIQVILNKAEKSTEIHIIDNGPGMTATQIEKAVQPFFTTKKFGTGLGLSICISLTERLNGEFTILDSDKGAHFLLRFPYENSRN